VSALWWTTNEWHVDGCDLCGTEVPHVLLRSSSDTTHWKAGPHEAPCGAPCLGGGVREAIPSLRALYGKDWLLGVHGRGEYAHGTEDGPGELLCRRCPNGCLFAEGSL